MRLLSGRNLALDHDWRISLERTSLLLSLDLVRSWENLLLKLRHLMNLRMLRRLRKRICCWIYRGVYLVSLLHLESICSIEPDVTDINLGRGIRWSWSSVETLVIRNIALRRNIERTRSRILSHHRLGHSLFVVLSNLEVVVGWRELLCHLIHNNCLVLLTNHRKIHMLFLFELLSFQVCSKKASRSYEIHFAMAVIIIDNFDIHRWCDVLLQKFQQRIAAIIFEAKVFVKLFT